MIYTTKTPKKSRLTKFLSIILTLCLILHPISYSAEASISLPAPGTLVPLSSTFQPLLLEGIKVFPQNPFRFDFIINPGDLGPNQEHLEKKSSQLAKYFLAALTTPKDDLWVNLSPYEKNRIIPEKFGLTEMGRDLLAQDYILKQIMSSLMYPENELGEQFWDRIYTKAYELYETTDIPINTFNKVWIVPEDASIYENKDTALIVDSKLKVMLEKDYLAAKHGLPQNQNVASNHVEEEFATEIIRSILIPEIEKEVNNGEHFAPLRQIYHALILATWFKQNLESSFLTETFVDQNKISGVDVENKNIKSEIYQKYLKAFKKGVYDYIKEEYDPTTQQIVPRKYFSGGYELGNIVLRNVSFVNRPNNNPLDLKLLIEPKYQSTHDNFMLSPKIHLANDEDKSDNFMAHSEDLSYRALSILEKFRQLENVKGTGIFTNADIMIKRKITIKRKYSKKTITRRVKKKDVGKIYIQYKGENDQPDIYDIIKNEKALIRYAKENGIEQELSQDNFMSQDAHTLLDYLTTSDYSFDELRDLLKDQENVDVFLLGNDDFKTFKEVIKLIETDIVQRLIISGGLGRLTQPLLKKALDNGYTIKIPNPNPSEIENGASHVDMTAEYLPYFSFEIKTDKKTEKRIPITESEIIFQIIQQMTTNPTVKDKIIKNTKLLKKATNTPGNFEEYKNLLEEENKISDPKNPHNYIFVQTAFQQRRSKGTNNQIFHSEIQNGLVNPISYTYSDENINVIIEIFKIILYSNKGDLMMQENNPDSNIPDIPTDIYRALENEFNGVSSKNKIEIGTYLARNIDSISKEVNLEKLLSVPLIKNILSYSTHSLESTDHFMANYDTYAESLEHGDGDEPKRIGTGMWTIYYPSTGWTKQVMSEDPDKYDEESAELIAWIKPEDFDPADIDHGEGELIDTTPTGIHIIYFSDSGWTKWENPIIDRDKLEGEQIIGYTDEWFPPGDDFMSNEIIAELTKTAEKYNIKINKETKINLFIGGPHIADGYYYKLFDDVVRKKFGYDLVYLPYPIKSGDEKRVVFIKNELKTNPRLAGAVITRPWKEEFADENSKIGAVNYMVKNHTTGDIKFSAEDAQAFIDGLNHDLGYEYDFYKKNLLIIGSGGAARELTEELNGKGIAHITFIDILQEKLNSLEDMINTLSVDYQTDYLLRSSPKVNAAIKNAHLSVNSSGIGRKDTKGVSPLEDHSAFHKGQIAYDLISNEYTQFLKEAQKQGVEHTFYGRSMFIYGMIIFIQGWIEQLPSKEFAPSDEILYDAIDRWLKVNEDHFMSTHDDLDPQDMDHGPGTASLIRGTGRWEIHYRETGWAKELILDFNESTNEFETTETWFVEYKNFEDIDHGVGEPVTPLHWNPQVNQESKTFYPRTGWMEIGVPIMGADFEINSSRRRTEWESPRESFTPNEDDQGEGYLENGGDSDWEISYESGWIKTVQTFFNSKTGEIEYSSSWESPDGDPFMSLSESINLEKSPTNTKEPMYTHGGIDFNPDKFLTINSEGKKVQFHLPDHLKDIDPSMIIGYSHTILSIGPLSSVPVFLGIHDPSGDSNDDESQDNFAAVAVRPNLRFALVTE